MKVLATLILNEEIELIEGRINTLGDSVICVSEFRSFIASLNRIGDRVDQ